MNRAISGFVVGSALLLFFVTSCGDQPGQREFLKGVSELKEGHYVRAASLLEKSINRRPGDAEANALSYNFLGISFWKLGQHERAVEALENSRRLNPDLLEPTYNLGLVRAAQGDLLNAARLLQEASLVDVDNPAPSEFLAHLYMKDEKWEEAAVLLQEAYQRAPGSPRVLTALGRVYLHTKSAEAAVNYLERALAADAAYPPALYNLGLINFHEFENSKRCAELLEQYLEVGRSEEHLETSRRMLRDLGRLRAASVRDPVRRIPEEQVEVETSEPKKKETLQDLLDRASTSAERGDVTSALRLCQEAAAKAARSGRLAWQEKAVRHGVAICPDDARAEYEWGSFLLAQGRNEEALQAFKSVREKDAKWAIGHASMAQAAVKVGEFDSALVGLKHAVKLEPENPDHVWNLAVLFDEHMGHKENAAVTYHHFTKLFPDEGRVDEARTKIRSLRPAPEKKVEEVPVDVVVDSSREDEGASTAASTRTLNLKKPVARNTRAAVQAYNRGTIYQERNDWDRAIYYYTRAVENDDLFADALYNLGMVYSAKGELDLAKDAYSRALRIRPDMNAARYNLALIHRELLEDEDAIEQLKIALENMPNYAPAHYVLGWLYAKDEDTHDLTKWHYRKFLALVPSGPTAPSVRQWLRTH